VISVAIITKNEEKNIKDALESVKWADEIIVVDAYSTDRTPEICRQFTDRVYSLEWSGFARQKQKAVSLTHQEWVLVLDADERVSDRLKGEIIEVLSGNPKHNGYLIARKNFFGDRWIRHGGWWPDYTLRLFRRGSGSFKLREVHESIQVFGDTGYLRNPILHYTYKDTNDFLERMETYATLGAKELHKDGRRAYIADLLLRPFATFVRMYFLRLGFLDGTCGLKLAYLYSRYTFRKYSELRSIKSGDDDLGSLV
jgi:glycosyltransferase involved in cell wall biosynthesis